VNLKIFLVLWRYFFIEREIVEIYSFFKLFNWDAEGTLLVEIFQNNKQTMQNKNISDQSGYLFIYLLQACNRKTPLCNGV
jgi:hypothetical protein